MAVDANASGKSATLFVLRNVSARGGSTRDRKFVRLGKTSLMSSKFGCGVLYLSDPDETLATPKPKKVRSMQQQPVPRKSAKAKCRAPRGRRGREGGRTVWERPRVVDASSTA